MARVYAAKLDKALVYVCGMKIKNGVYLIIVSYDKQQQQCSIINNAGKLRPCLSI
ncbi:MAG: hypothetical protein WKG06_04460 [Segetibacter sp.]